MVVFAARHVDVPREGFFKKRLFARGPFMPVRIYRPLLLDPHTGELLDRWPPLLAEVGDEEITDHDGIVDIWPYCREITFGEWKILKEVQWPMTRP